MGMLAIIQMDSNGCCVSDRIEWVLCEQSILVDLVSNRFASLRSPGEMWKPVDENRVRYHGLNSPIDSSDSSDHFSFEAKELEIQGLQVEVKLEIQ